MARGYEILGKRDLRAASKPPDSFSSKRGRGTALIVAGSELFHGAPVLAALASLRVGAGYVKLYVPGSVINPVRSLSPNIIVERLGDRSIVFNKRIKEEIARSDAVALGMGIGRSATAIASAKKIMLESVRAGKAIVVDADALAALKKLPAGRTLNRNVIATPHDGEFFRLAGVKPALKDINARIKVATGFAKKLNITLVLKGHYSIVTEAGEPG